MKTPIHAFSVYYNLLRSYVKLYLRVFYHKTTIVGRENIPSDKPIILAINHQNALMDALTVLGVLKHKNQPVFMARSDIFKSPLAAKILRFLKILPIYRIRDGIKSLQNNDAVFNEAVQVLTDKKMLAILPEGNHSGHRRLRSLKKGIARIAFQAEEQNQFQLDIQVIPVGLDYTHYINFGANLLVNFGTPMSLNNFKAAYLENPQKGMGEFMQALRENMLPGMLHIDDSDNYDEIEFLKDLYLIQHYQNRVKNIPHMEVLNRSQSFIEKILKLKSSAPEKFTELLSAAQNIKKAVQKLNLRPWVLYKKRYNWYNILISRILQFITLPVYLVGFLLNIIPFQMPVYFARKVKDPQFLSSFRFALGLLTFTFVYLIYLILLLVFIKPFVLAIGLFASIPVLGIVSFIYYRWYKKTSAKWRNNRYLKNKDATFMTMHKNMDRVKEIVEKVL